MRSLNELIRNPTFSVYREHLFHQLFTSELLKSGWVAGYVPIEIAHPEVDFQGYDVVLTCGHATRHVQLKAAVSDPPGADVHKALADKPAGCLIFLRPLVSQSGADLSFTYRFLGGAPGEPLTLDGYQASRNPFYSRDAGGMAVAKKRTNHVYVPIGRFSKKLNIDQLLRHLFGEPSLGQDVGTSATGS